MKREEDFEANLSGEEGTTEESKTNWFKRIKKGILTSTAEKKETPEGLWTKCPSCNYICTMTELRENLFVCPKCNHHHRIGSDEYFEILFNDNKYDVMFENIRSKDFLHFTDLKSYEKRLEETWAKTDITDSIRIGTGQVKDHHMVVGCMDFEFIGGSLGSVMGERITRAIDYCLEHLQIRRGQNDGKRFFLNATGQGIRQTFPINRRPHSLYLFTDRSLFRRDFCFFWHAGRPEYCRTGCADWFCRSPRNQRNHQKRSSGRFPAQRISTGTRVPGFYSEPERIKTKDRHYSYPAQELSI